MLGKIICLLMEIIIIGKGIIKWKREKFIKDKMIKDRMIKENSIKEHSIKKELIKEIALEINTEMYHQILIRKYHPN